MSKGAPTQEMLQIAAAQERLPTAIDAADNRVIVLTEVISQSPLKQFLSFNLLIYFLRFRDQYSQMVSRFRVSSNDL